MMAWCVVVGESGGLGFGIRWGSFAQALVAGAVATG